MLPASFPRYRIYSKPEYYLKIISAVLTGRIRSGKDCHDLESDISTLQNIEFALCTPKARVAIFLAVRALLKQKRKVILSPYTISDVINMVICAGGIPVFADLQEGTCNIDPEEIEKLIDDQTGAVLVTHLHGLSCKMDRIGELCKQHNIALIEDAAQAFGAKYNGQPLGTFGEAGIYSFGMYKNVNSFFGGILVTPDRDIYNHVKLELGSYPYQETGYYCAKVLSGLITDIATWPPLFRAITFWIFRYGFLHDIGVLNKHVTFDQNPAIKTDLPESYLRRLTPLQARLVRSQLSEAWTNNQKRIENAARYHDDLQGIRQIGLPPMRSDGSHIYTYFPIIVKDRDGLLKHLMKNGCDIAAQHLKNCADMDCFRDYARDCPVARATCQQVVLLPTYPRYRQRDIEKNIEMIRQYFKPESMIKG